MNIHDLGDREKSIMLARLVWRETWVTDEADNIISRLFYDDSGGLPIWTSVSPSLYESSNMPLARKILQWANMNYMAIRMSLNHQRHIAYMFTYEDDGVREALDVVCQLAVEKGLAP